VCWTSDEFDPDGSSGVFARRFNAAGDPLGTEFCIPKVFDGNQCGACIAATAPNEFAVSWIDKAPDHLGVFLQRFSFSRDEGPSSRAEKPNP
jgi:hypothetical protein